ncbi:MAG: sigma-70 family RNA polymerase sigma factor [Actinomycetota bacterium]|nr:sigma-70 family RNA polymerase sigma factor [Actinomycetota bacterium]
MVKEETDAHETVPALERLYETHIDRAVRLAFLITGDRELAQDIAHDAFVKIAARFHDLRHREAFPAYLRSTVLNLGRSHLRRLRVQRDYLKREASRRDTETYSTDFEARDEMWAALQKLPYRRRAALVLRYYEDLTEEQTADALSCSVPAVKALVARGLEGLRAMDREET